MVTNVTREVPDFGLGGLLWLFVPLLFRSPLKGGGAGRPCGKVENAGVSRFPLFHRAALGASGGSFFLFWTLFSFFPRNSRVQQLFHRADESCPMGYDAERWGCGSWGQRSLVDSLGLEMPPPSFFSCHPRRPTGMVLCGRSRPEVALPSRHDAG